MDYEKITAMIADTLGIDAAEITPESSLVDDLGADSLDLVELHMAFEEATGTKIPDETLAKLAKVQDIVDYLKTLNGEAQ